MFVGDALLFSKEKAARQEAIIYTYYIQLRTINQKKVYVLKYCTVEIFSVWCLRRLVNNNMR